MRPEQADYDAAILAFTMNYTPEQFPSETAASMHYAKTKNKLEDHLRQAIKNAVPISKALFCVPLDEKSKNHIGLYYNDNKVPVFGFFEEKTKGVFSRYETVDQKDIGNIPADVWDRLVDKCKNGTAFKNCEILNEAYLKTVKPIDNSYIIACKNREFTEDTAFSIAEMLKERSENDIVCGVYGHSLRVAENLQRFAKAGGIAENETRHAFIAGLLHDTGKYFIPEEILNKPGKLSDQEYAAMKEHTNLGAGFLQSIGAPKEVVTTTLLHHQQSKHYPLSKCDNKKIPDLVKMATIIDIYDSLINKRGYKTAMSAEKVKEIMDNDAKQGALDAKLYGQFKEFLNKGVFDFSEDAVYQIEKKINRTSEMLKIKAKIHADMFPKNDVSKKMIDFKSTKTYRRSAVLMG